LILVLMALPIFGYAQLKVASSGKVAIATSSPFAGSMLSVGSNSFNSTYKMGVYSNLHGFSTTVGVGVLGYGNNTIKTSACLSVGILGIGASTIGGTEYGVMGLINGTMNGAAVLGSTIGRGWTLSGRYAGFFYGDTYIDGSLTTGEVIIPSTQNGLDNISSFSERTKDALSDIMQMKVISFNYKYVSPRESEGVPAPNSENDDAKMKEAERMAQKKAEQKHFGLSIEELQKIYPELVRTGQDGNHGINYVELIPVLVQSIQELKQELDELRGVSKAPEYMVSTEVGNINAIGSNNVLYQNVPNPFKGQTIIRFKLAENAKEAAICIYDMSGKLIQKCPISSGMENISVGGYELNEGLYLYSLVVNGREIDTKKMVITK